MNYAHIIKERDELKMLVARLKTELSRAQNEAVSKCDRCDFAYKHECGDCLRCNGTGWITTIKQERRELTPKEVGIPAAVLQVLENSLRDSGLHQPLGTFGFLDMTVQPYGGMYSNPHPYGEPYEVRLIKSNYYVQQRDDARAFAHCEAAYLEAPE